MIYLYNPCNPCCDDDGPAHDGWWFGGFPAGANADRHIYGMNFATDTTIASTVGLLSENRNPHASLTHQDEAVYVCGGDTSDRFTPTPINGEKFAMSTEVGGSSTSLRLTEKAQQLAAVSERSEKGYFAGGISTDNFGVLQLIATAWKVTFSSDTVGAQSTADLTVARHQVVGLTEGNSKGYFAGGVTAQSFVSATWTKTVDKITFASDSTSASSSAELPAERGNMNQSGVSDGDTKGYLCGGVSVSGGQPVDTVYKVTFSGDTTANVTSASLSTPRHVFAGMSEGTTKGYVSGGQTSGSGETNAADKITFSSDSVAAVTTADLPNGRTFHTGSSAIGL